MKKFSFEGRFESGLDDVVKGKAFAFTPGEMHADGKVGLGVAIANEPGYLPIPSHWCIADNYAEMADHCDDLNAAEGLDPKAAAIIVCSSMGAGKVA